MLRIRLQMVILSILFFSTLIFGQTVSYQGPATGNEASGVVLNTESFSDSPIGSNDVKEFISRNNDYVEPPIFLDHNVDLSNYPSVYTEDITDGIRGAGIGDNVLLLNKFDGIPQTNSIPPDPHIAVGPNHVVATVNSRFSIWDKQGNLLKSIDADAWCSPVLPNPGAFDPQIIYDHYEGRWFMLWDNNNDATQTAFFIIFVSDDDDPNGVWYGWKSDATANGNTPTTTWGDYPQVGFDDKAIYINSRQFFFSGSYLHNKIRIFNKAELYAANAGPISWKDLWDITQPGGLTRLDVIHPSYHYSTSDAHYFLWANRTGANFYALYEIRNPLTTPVLTGTNIIVPTYYNTPDANQLGGGTPLIASNGSHIKTAPVFRDGYLYATHSVGAASGSPYSNVKYVKIDVTTKTVVEDAQLGATGFYYIFPTIAVDKDHNVAITFSRSADTEYIGAYYSARRNSDLPGLSPSYELAAGQGNYVKTFGGTRNRWGDYLGIYLDPEDEYSIWLFPEYAAATNTWGTVVGQIRIQPYEGPYAYISSNTLDFGRVEVGFDGDTLTAYLANYGDTSLTISNIPDSVGAFHLISSHTFPITLETYDSMEVKFQFKPRQLGELDVFYPVANNSSNFTGIDLKGYGFIVFPAESNKFFAISGFGNGGQLLNINPATGAGSNLGPSFFDDIVGLSINPKTKFVYGLRTGGTNSEVVRINAQDGDAYKLFEINLPSLFSMAFDSAGQLYVASTGGQIFSIDTTDGSYDSVSQMPVSRVALAFNHLNNELWGSIKSIGGVRDRIIKVDLLTGDTTIVGQTGFAVNTIDLAFDELGNLFGIKGNNTTPNDFFSIDQTTGVGTLIGSVGMPDLKGLAFSTDVTTSIDEDDEVIVREFALEQNYPNPFNPITTINFSVANTASVKLTVYNILGEAVRVLLDKEMQSGSYNVVWNADDYTGKKVSSGVYFYELKASSPDGNNFNQIRKMVLLK